MLVARGPGDNKVDLTPPGHLIRRGPRGGGAAPAGWNAGDWGTVAFEYDFSDIATLFTDAARSDPVDADDDVLGGVTDKSGNGRHITQGTTINKPIYKASIQNGLSVARFAGNNESLFSASFGLSQPHTILFVYFASVASNNADVLNSNASFQSLVRNNTSTLVLLFAGSNANFNVGNTLNEWMQITAVFNGASSQVLKNSVSAGTGNPGASNITTGIKLSKVATPPTFTGDIGHVIGYSGLLADRAGAEAALMSKWGIA